MCKTEGCENPARRRRYGRGKGYCDPHYRDIQRAAGTLPEAGESQRDPAACLADGCSNPVKLNKRGFSQGYCVAHYGTSGRENRTAGSRWRDGDGYMQVKLPDGRVIGEHRAVMEQHLGRRLVRGETVHHINGVRHDNRLENLELWFSPQPYGQRVEDLLRYAITTHRAALEALLNESAGDAEPAA